MAFLFCNISWMTYYKGQYNKQGNVIDQPAGGGKYVEKNDEAHESCNFLADENDSVYGYVSTWRGNHDTGKHSAIKIENFGASKNDSYIDNVDIIWIAKHPNGGKRVVGWYKGARVYRQRQLHNPRFVSKQHERDNIDSYRIVCSKKNVHLIKEQERELKLDRGPGWPGRSSVFYPANHQSNLELNSLIKTLMSLIYNKKSSCKNDKKVIFTEGEEKLALHKEKERSATLVKQFKAQLSDFSCSICGFSFENFYGPLGKQYIEAHHIRPISKLIKSTTITISDLAAVCSNCHRMLHRSKEITNTLQLKNIVKSKNLTS